MAVLELFWLEKMPTHCGPLVGSGSETTTKSRPCHADKTGSAQAGFRGAKKQAGATQFRYWVHDETGRAVVEFIKGASSALQRSMEAGDSTPKE